MSAQTKQTNFRYYDLLMAAFVTILLCSNIIGAAKVSTVNLPWYGAFTFGTGIFFFPISYIFGDVLTEVYGYARSRKVIWAGFGAMIFASFMSWFILAMPPAPDWPYQEQFELVLGATPRITFASLTAFFVGEFCNSYVMAKLKVKTKGKWLWVRTIGSTIVGEGIDSLIFYPLAFWGPWSTELVIQVMIANYLIKVLWETMATPFTYKLVNFLKRAENEDYYDVDTNFSPFTIKT